MKTSKFSETQISTILKEQVSGVKVVEICRKHGISPAAFYKWWPKYTSMLKRAKELEAENARLKRMCAESQMDQLILKEALTKNGNTKQATRDGAHCVVEVDNFVLFSSTPRQLNPASRCTVNSALN